MKPFFDSSVLIAALIETHPHHQPAAALLNEVFAGGHRACISAHGLAEVYAVLTRTPFPLRIFPQEAWMMLKEGILPYTEVVPLTDADYRALVEQAALNNWPGGRIYDLVHIRAAQIAGCTRLYTFNVKEFRAMAPRDLQTEICTP